MTLVRDTVANFIGGVSQQPDKLMYPNQSKKLVNYLPMPSIGLKDRPPTEHIAKLLDTPLTKHPLIHTIIKEEEEYTVILKGDGSIKVFDLQGTEKTVVIDEDCAAYITTNNPLKDLFATTIADYTFILNKTKITELSDDLYPNPYNASALIFVRQGNYTTDHKITVNGSVVGDYTSTDDLATTKTNKIAQELYNDLVTNLGTTNWNITREGSVICLQKKDGSDFTIQSEDSNANNDLYTFYKSADAINVLPTVAPDGFILKLVGEDVNKADDYYVQFETADGSAFGTGSWKECCSPDIPYHIDETTMPHALIRQANGTFLFTTIDWTDRGAGDEDSAPTPSFIGNTIQDVFTHKGRLAFLSLDKSIYSDTQDIFSFFKKTTVAELDTDPIDVGSNSKMVLLKHNLPFNEELLLFSETSVFSIKGGDIFSNSTVACDLTMEYPCSRFVKPINAGGTGFFVFENGDYSRVMEIFITSTYSIDARDVTEQVPSYLPKNIYKIAGSTAQSLACFLSTSELSSIYVYNYYYSSEQKAQSAWSKWTFGGDVLNVDFKENLMYLTIQYDDGVYLEKMNFTPKNKEANLDYLFYLDRKAILTGGSYSSGRGDTSFVTPYIIADEEDNLIEGIKIINKQGFPIPVTQIRNTTSNGVTYTTIWLKGDLSDEPVYIGFPFESKWEMPIIYYRQQTQNGTKVVEGTLMLRDINLCYADTGHFEVKVTPKYSTNITSEFEFTGKIVGMKSATLGHIEVSSGNFLIPIIARNEEVTIEITNNGYLPSCFLSMEWLGDLIIRGQ